METIYLKIAGYSITIICSPSEYLQARKKFIKDIKYYCQGFIILNPPKKIHLAIHVSEHPHFVYSKNSQNKVVHFIKIGEEKKSSYNTYYYIGIPLFIHLLGNILSKLIMKDGGFFLHAAANQKRQIAYLFTGPSGTGKSTITTLIHPEFPSIADDCVIIKKESGNYYLYQIPLIEKAQYRKKSSKRLKIGSVFFLRKKKFFKIEKINKKQEILTMISSQLWTEKDNLNSQVNNFISFVQNTKSFNYLSFALNRKNTIQLIASYAENNK